MKKAGHSAFIGILRDATWLTADRATAYGRVLAAVTLVAGVLWIVTAYDGLDLTGKPIGTDFLSFWAASKLALAGTPTLAYDVAAHAAAQRAAFDGTDPGYFAFFYPPLFLLICWPLALLPYGGALALWLGLTGLAYWRVVARFCGPQALTLPILAFPAVLTTLGHGQNAFLSTALFGGAILARGRPILAGILFGALAFKPHLGLLIPVYLLASGAWTAMLAAIGTVLALAVAATVAFGPAIWPAFLATMPLARRALEGNLVGAEKMQSAFAAVQLWNGPLGLGYAAQAIVAVAAVAGLVTVIRARPDTEAAGPLLVAATLLASPFLLDYDLTLLAIPLAWTFTQGSRTGFLPWEKSVLLAGFLMPLFSRAVAQHTGLPLGPLVIAALFVAVWRRGFALPQQQLSTLSPAPTRTVLTVRAATMIEG